MVIDAVSGNSILNGLLGPSTSLGSNPINSLGSPFLGQPHRSDRPTQHFTNEPLYNETTIDLELGTIHVELGDTNAAVSKATHKLFNNYIFGTSDRDQLFGTHGSDHMVGGGDRDDLFGSSGNDVLIGVDTNDADPGKGEIDILTGGLGKDTFVLGHAGGVYYDDDVLLDQGFGDYALITDFTMGDDSIRLSGSAKYSLQNVALRSGTGAGIYKDEGFLLDTEGIFHQSKELIGVVHGVDASALTINTGSTLTTIV
ncbi:MAG: hypothetical protein AAFQ89_12575 [Cyanobacteria bacterium J06626_18]